jgi:hypothetical protein
LLKRALALAPDERFPSAGAFADAIDELMFAQGWRGGGGALRDRLRAAFPDERERLNALFEPGKQREGLAVTQAASPREGTVLSRVVAATPAAEAPARRTIIAAPPSRGSGPGRWVAAVGLGAIVGLAVLFVLGTRAHPVAVGAMSPNANTPSSSPSSSSPPSNTSSLTPTPTPTSAGVESPHAAAAPVASPTKIPIAMGTISVNASPWATVHVNGKLAGTTPILRFPVRAGRASVTIENPKLGRKQVDVKIEPKKDTPLIVDLRAASAWTESGSARRSPSRGGAGPLPGSSEGDDSR